MGVCPPLFSFLFGQILALVYLVVTPEAKSRDFVVAGLDASPFPAAPIAVSRLDLLA